ncbi:autotransporter domain-containing protein [Pseudostreptobacillus hongkongensis]|uniref:autotransporter outer membrane beta-barrel domain-containing protein n=1 Tax=Pseudostreptobacillus hongkongensis TaxID=1162717 RepID=UPI0028D01503|nr:autotransporter domain-containing protein [Pseudostreptobacillus hongkongensis]
MNSKKKVLSLLFLIFCISCSSTSKVEYTVRSPRNNKPVETVADFDEDGVYIFETNVNKEELSKIRIRPTGVTIANVSENDSNGTDDKSHAQSVIDSFLDKDNNYEVDNNNEKININIASYKDADIRLNVKGIINMSYGYVSYNTNMKGIYDVYYKNKYIDGVIKNDNIKGYFLDDFSNLLFDADYKNNLQLKIKSLGNYGGNNHQDSFITNNSHILYENMDKETQKRARSEMIYVKNMIGNDKNVRQNLTDRLINKVTEGRNKVAYTTSDGIDYYEVQNRGYFNVKPFLLRSYTVVDRGFITNDDNTISDGSSFAAPKVTRLAYEIHKKYPFLTYHQIKEVILTTAKRDNSGYLSNIVGWGIVDRDKAMNGLSDLNAGLIEETKFFEDMNNKIYDKDGNIYQYLDVNNGSYEFKNDITSGLKGDGNNIRSEIFNLKGKGLPDESVKNYTLRLAKVLDSEKNYYANVKQAGLRKAGNGELILSGNQDYSTKTQILEGKLTLKNNSKSKYEVFDKGALNIEGNHINIQNDILNDGKVIFNALNNQVNDYKASSKSETILNTSKLVNAKSFKTDGKIKIDVDDISDLNKVKTLVKSNDINIKDTSLLNIYLDNLNVSNNEVSVKINTNRDIASLNDEELRNIPTYNYNEKKFFNNYIAMGRNSNLTRNLLNLSAHNKEEAISQLFTSNYSDFVSNIFENNRLINNNIEFDKYRENSNLSLYYNNLYNTNIVNNDKYSGFSNILLGNMIGIDKKINDDLNVGLFLSNYTNKIRYNNDSIFNSKNYQIGSKLQYRFNDFILNNTLNYTYNINDVNRKLVDSSINSKFDTHFISDSINLSYNKKIDNNKFGIFTNIDLMNLKLGNIVENSNSSNLVLELKANNVFKVNLGLGVNYSRIINDYLSINGEVKYDFFTDKKVELNSKLGDVEFKLKGEDLLNHNISSTLGLDLTLDKFKLNLKGSLDNKLKFGISTTFKYEF